MDPRWRVRSATDFGEGTDVVLVAVRQQYLFDRQPRSRQALEDFIRVESWVDDRGTAQRSDQLLV